jgi:signal transduction histidine kinase
MLSPWKRLAQSVGLTMPDAHVKDAPFDRRTLETFARVAHEARQPLSAARAAFELIRRSPGDAQRERAYAVVERQFVRLARLFDDLLDASSVHRGTTTLRMAQLDLRGLVEELSESVRPQMAAKHQRLATHWPQEPVWIEGDAVRLQQVVSNLLVNGIKYTDRGGRVSIDLALRPGDAVLTVSDTGRGISADFLPQIFEPFIRGDATSEEGLGVGLAIARELVELHGGTICASSAGPGNGSKFVVTLPAWPSRYREAQGGGQTATTLGSTEHLRP